MDSDTGMVVDTEKLPSLARYGCMVYIPEPRIIRKEYLETLK